MKNLRNINKFLSSGWCLLILFCVFILISFGLVMYQESHQAHYLSQKGKYKFSDVNVLIDKKKFRSSDDDLTFHGVFDYDQGVSSPVTSKCPCAFNVKENFKFKDSINAKRVCVYFHEDVDVSLEFSEIEVTYAGLQISMYRYRNIDSQKHKKSCDANMTVVPDNINSKVSFTDMRFKQVTSCPGICFPIPNLEIPESIILGWINATSTATSSTTKINEKQSGIMENIFVTCSAVLWSIIEGFFAEQERSSFNTATGRLGYFFFHSFWRRIAECNEQKYWQNSIRVRNSDIKRDKWKYQKGNHIFSNIYIKKSIFIVTRLY